ncbi:hypothetical protein A1O3_09061 [Capronia epimyces CBS 606.96]|uniref:Uncharacterized protein n=1 Tax=Capronia epimyces CBS 606.96 TaxID=1182542 RepID=W9XBQ8_9EURO|nr:uncharacterized protein A1O3_09061 [Capronia epimyces CBS 606.96]EXJ77902.1 hypothetical protein A1O3_09061 [Capronia epimyces CBS 606.96]
MATSGHRPEVPSREKSTSAPSIIRRERSRRILNLVTNSIIPCFTLHLSNACNRLAIAIVPSDVLRASGPVTEQNIVAPALPNETTASVIPLTGDENRSSFWTQYAVVQEVDVVLRWELCGSSTIPKDVRPEDDQSNPPSPPVQPQDTASRPAPPSKKSWLKRTFVLPGPDHDPTGETGKWNLGWRESDSPTGEGSSWSDRPLGAHSSGTRMRTRTRTLQPDEIDVHTNLQDVSFRTESELGLLETTTVRCIWVEIEVGI